MAQTVLTTTVSQTIINNTNPKVTEGEGDREHPRSKTVRRDIQTAGHPPSERTFQIIATRGSSQQYTRAVTTRHFRESRRMSSKIRGQRKNERYRSTRTEGGDRDTIQVRISTVDDSKKWG